MKKEGLSMILFFISFITLIASAVIYLRREDNDFSQFKIVAEKMSKDVESLSKKLDQIREENKKLQISVDAAHDQADAAKSKAEFAENLAHKVAIDVAKKPIHAIQAQTTPIKVEPIRVVIYDKRDLQNKTKTVKPTVEDQVIKKVRQELQKNN